MPPVVNPPISNPPISNPEINFLEADIDDLYNKIHGHEAAMYLLRQRFVQRKAKSNGVD